MTSTIQIPFNIGPTGRIARAEGDYAVAAQHLKNILLTRVSERVMRPTYGSRVRDALFEPIDEILLQELDDDIRDAIGKWEPGVEVRAIEMDDRGSFLEIDIQFTLSSTLGGADSRVSVSISRGGNVEETT